MRQGKIWGETEEIFNNGIISINHLKIKRGGHCSEHRHSKKSNIFYVLNGNLKLSIWTPESVRDDTVIWPGEKTEVLPGVYHQFEALTDVECLEIYQIKLDPDDINRRTTGGIE